MQTNRKAGFTLVEMLVVIAIIGVLAAMLIRVAATVRAKAQETRIKTEIDQMDAALKSYKNDVGAFPPNFTDLNRVKRHLRKAFPRMKETTVTLDTLTAANYSPAEALVFWLSGFSADAEYPLTGSGGPLSSNPGGNARFDFDRSRLGTGDDADSRLAYFPPNLIEPFVYFDTSQTYATEPKYTGTNGTLVPYYADADNNGTPEYANFLSCQVVSAGLDDEWGADLSTAAPLPLFPVGKFTGGHADNLVNFSTKNLRDSEP